MRIVEVITGGEAGGAQRHVAELTEYLAGRGHETYVLHGGGSWLGDRLQTAAAVKYVASMGRSLSPRDIQALRDLIRAIAPIRPGLLHAHSSKAGILVRAAGKILNIPVVYTAHGLVFTDPTLPDLTRRLYRVLESWGSRRSAAVIVMTAPDLAFVRGAAPRTRAVLIPNGVAVGQPRHGRSWKRPRVGFIGRFSAEKGLNVLIEAARSAAQWEWIIAGDGPLQTVVAHAAARYPHITWKGWVENTLDFFDTIDVLVQPSFKEGLPYTVLDAMAQGVPVVSTPVGGLPELVGGVDTSLLFPPGDAQALLQAVRWALGGRQRLGPQCQQLIARHYSLQQQLAETEKVLLWAGQK